MKYTFTFLLILVCLPIFAQKELSYHEEVEASGWSKQELYDRAQQWLRHLNYQASFDDPASGFISVGGEMRLRQPGGRKLRKGKLIYVVTLIVEEQKYWYDFAQFYYDVVPTNPREASQGNWLAAEPSNPANAPLYQAVEAMVRQKIEDLKRTMLAKNENPSDSPVETMPMGNKQ